MRQPRKHQRSDRVLTLPPPDRSQAGRLYNVRAFTSAAQGCFFFHFSSEELPPHAAGDHISNSDPVTGQAGWFDVRVRIYPAEAGEPQQTSPQFAPLQAVPGMEKGQKSWLAYFAGKGEAK